ncbi:hypothetical protein [Vibrio phage vB_pir03]|nr:hypothetical protein [Vibrio phage vB_pir03]
MRFTCFSPMGYTKNPWLLTTISMAHLLNNIT